MRSAVLLLIMTIAMAGAAESWKLIPINGNQPNKWKEGENWTFAKGNPLKVEGGEWLLAYQEGDDPAPSAEYKPMHKGIYVNYYYVWQGDKDKVKDPRLSYRGMVLKARPKAKGIHMSEASAIVFTPEEAGKYKVELAGKIKVQNPTAGCAVITFGVLSADGKNFKVVKSEKYNSDNPKAYGKYPSACKLEESLELVAGEKIILRLQTNSPGKANAGSSALILEAFTITKE